MKSYGSFKTNHSATVWFLASVIASMLFKGHQCRKLLVAKIAVKWFLPRMSAYVNAAKIYRTLLYVF